MTSPFDPTDDDLARIDRARVEAWLTAHGWERVPGPMPERAGCWWRHGGREFSSVRYTMVVPADGVADAARRWLEVLHTVSEANGLRWLALSAVVVAWQAPAVGVGP